MTSQKTVRQRLNPVGFSLVEVVLALGICSFAMMAIAGMIPVGLTTFRNAMDTGVQSQIVQRLAGEILLTDYWNIESKVYYYDEQGGLILSRTPQDDPHLAYTAIVQTGLVQMPVSGNATVTEDSASTVLIQIAHTRPGQTFAQIQQAFPRQIHSYPLVVGNTHSLNAKPRSN